MQNDQESDAQTTGLFRFADAELDLRAHTLTVAGALVHIEARVLRLLAALLGRPGETLTKDELLEAAWPGRVVTEGALTKAIMKLRQVLGDDKQQIIRTVHGFGYRLAVPIEEVGSSAPASIEFESGQRLPARPNWQLVKSLAQNQRGNVWLVEHVKTRDRRVLKFARDLDELVMIKREITLYRLIHEALGEDAAVVRLLDWNLEEPPYFTEAEWIEGGELSHWIGSDAGVGERIEIVAKLADAVSAMHGLGIVHKDLKPANVLLEFPAGEKAKVVLSDFGIGTLSDPRTIDALRITRLGFTATSAGSDNTSGTPLYIAPEVMAGAVPTQRSDIYALGVILYQVLVADPVRPLAPGWERDIVDELLREDIAAAADVDPERRLGDASELARRLRTLEARRTERAVEQAARVQARLNSERLARGRLRLKWLMALSSVLLMAVATSTWLYFSAEREREIATTVNRFLNEDLLAHADPYVSHQPGMTVRSALDRASATVATRFADQPRAEAAVQMTLAYSYRGIGEYAAAWAHALRAEELTQDHYPAGSEQALEVARLLGGLQFDLGELDDGDRRLNALADQAARRYGENSPVTLEIALGHASQRNRRRDPEKVLALVEPILPTLERNRRNQPELWTRALTLRGNALREAGHRQQARADLEQALQFAASALGPETLQTLSVMESLGQLHRAEGRFEDAERLHRQVLEGRVAKLGRNQPETQGALNELAVVLQDMGRHDEAEPLLREVLQVREHLYGERNPLTRDILNNLGMSLSLTGRLDEAEIYYRRALDIERELLGADHLDVLILSHNLAGLLRRKGEHPAAIELHREAVARAEATLGPERAEPGLFMVGLAHTLGDAGRFAESDAAYEQAYLRMKQALGDDHPRVSRVQEMREEMRSRGQTASAGIAN
jgi:eukaryotic-like serine/threonine-protein kinase